MYDYKMQGKENSTSTLKYIYTILDDYLWNNMESEKSKYFWDHKKLAYMDSHDRFLNIM